MMTYEQWLIQQRMIATLSGDELTPEEIALDWRYYQQRQWNKLENQTSREE